MRVPPLHVYILVSKFEQLSLEGVAYVIIDTKFIPVYVCIHMLISNVNRLQASKFAVLKLQICNFSLLKFHIYDIVLCGQQFVLLTN